jgi:hypothetical protein
MGSNRNFFLSCQLSTPSARRSGFRPGQLRQSVLPATADNLDAHRPFVDWELP